MSKDLEIIKELEETYGIKLKRLAHGSIFLGEVGYKLGKSREVVGLSLFQVKISDLSSLTDLTNLKALDLDFTQVNDLSPLCGLMNLNRLFLNKNLVSDLSPLTELKNLTYLDVRDNRITHLPEEFLDMNMEIKWELGGREGLFLEGNPLVEPPMEIVKQGREAIKTYFASIKGKRRALNEVKVLLVGDGGAGKTSLVKRLLGEDFDTNEEQTHGINIRNWQVKPDKEKIKVNLWDFGGQEIMHATHQFFLSKRSLYILVLDGRKDEKVEYWLKLIESFGGNSPVLIVINKIDQNPRFDVNRVFLQGKYKHIKGFYRVSCKKGTGIKDFSRNMVEELAKVELIGTTWGESWFRVKSELEQTTEDFISYMQYKFICENAGIKTQISRDTLVDFLHDLGVVLHFKDFKLEETHVLQPEWVTNAVYKIINSPLTTAANGVLKLKTLSNILKQEKETDFFYPRDKYRYIIDLMQKFELCYEVDSDAVLIPDLLQIHQPEFDFDYASALKFLIQYDFLPRSVMPRFIVKMHKDIKERLHWRTGVVIEYSAFKSTAVVVADNEEKHISIFVQGEQRRDYLSVILFALREINNSFEKLQAVEKVPMPGEPEIAVSYKHLLRLEKKGKLDYIPDGSDKEYNVKKLLGTVQTEKRSDEEILKILQILVDKSDTVESLVKKAQSTLLLQPNFMGFGLDLKSLAQKAKNLFDKKNR